MTQLIRDPIQLSYCPSGYFSRRIENIAEQYLRTCVYSSIICNSSVLETTKMPTNQGIDKKILYNGVLPWDKERQTRAFYMWMNATRAHTQVK